MTKPAPSAAKNLHTWSKDALLAKAQRYAEDMLSHPHDDWRFGLTSTFVLEFVSRAALAAVSPTLLADQKDWNHLYFALGHTPVEAKFIPKSIDISAVLTRLRVVVPTFTKELEGFALQHVNRRNEELHSGSTPFDGLQTGWLAHFYEAIEVLLGSMGENLALLVGREESDAAGKMISASKDESAKAVNKEIDAHKTVWGSKDTQEQQRLARQASAWASRQTGHCVQCPACGNDALVVGEPISEPIRRLDGDLIIEAQDHLPSRFECVACQLKIPGLSRLTVCGLGATYKKSSTYDAAEFYAPEDEYRGYEDDNNEP